MTLSLSSLDWTALTAGQARTLIGAAERHERRFGRIWNDSGDPADETAWRAAFMLWEDLRVYALCGEKPSAEQ